MKMPMLTQSVQPLEVVHRLVGYGRQSSATGVSASGGGSVGCIVCHAACSALPGFLQGPCNALCDAKAC
jgi:hypothetical protein